MKEVTMTRQDLYDLVWKESMLSLSKKYAISSTGLKKKCKAFNIPVPGIGYWAKLQFGKTGGRKTPLPVFNGNQVIRLIKREESDAARKSQNELKKQLALEETIHVTVPV